MKLIRSLNHVDEEFLNWRCGKIIFLDLTLFHRCRGVVQASPVSPTNLVHYCTFSKRLFCISAERPNISTASPTPLLTTKDVLAFLQNIQSSTIFRQNTLQHFQHSNTVEKKMAGTGIKINISDGGSWINWCEEVEREDPPGWWSRFEAKPVERPVRVKKEVMLRKETTYPYWVPLSSYLESKMGTEAMKQLGFRKRVAGRRLVALLSSDRDSSYRKRHKSNLRLKLRIWKQQNPNY